MHFARLANLIIICFSIWHPALLNILVGLGGEEAFSGRFRAL